MAEYEGGVREAAGGRECAESKEFANGVVVVVEAAGNEDGVNGLELAHGGAALRKGHAPLPCLAAAVVAAREDVGHVRALLRGRD